MDAARKVQYTAAVGGRDRSWILRRVREYEQRLGNERLWPWRVVADASSSTEIFNGDVRISNVAVEPFAGAAHASPYERGRSVQERMGKLAATVTRAPYTAGSKANAVHETLWPGRALSAPGYCARCAIELK